MVKLSLLFSKKIKQLMICLLLILLPTQFGKHFFFDGSYVNGLKIDYLSIILYTTDLLALIILILFTPLLHQAIKKNQRRTLIFASCLIINILIAKQPVIALYQSVKLIEFIMLVIIFKSIEIKPYVWFSFFFINGLFELILSTLQLINRGSVQGIFYFFGERYLTLSTIGIAKFFIQGREYLRPYGTFSHPNSMAGFYILVYFFLLLLPISDKTEIKIKVIRGLTLSICSLLIIISFSKIVLLTFIVLNILYFLLSRKISCKACFISRLITMSVLSVLVFSASINAESINNRVLLFDHSLTILKNQPLFGVGLGNYLYFEAQLPSSNSLFIPQPVHNIFLLVMTELGLVISVIFIYLLLPYLTKIIKEKKYFLCLIAVFITGMFDHYWLTLQQNFLLLAVIIGSISAGKQKLKLF